MSPRAASIDDGGGGRAAVTVLLVLAVALGMLMLVRGRPDPGAFDPRSGRPDGARALVLLLEQRGVSVDVGRAVPSPGADTRVLVLSDQLGGQQRVDLLDFIEAGGVAVVADPASNLHGGPGIDGGSVAVDATDAPGGLGSRLDGAAEAEANVVNERCSIGALDHLRGVFVPDGLLFPVGPDEPSCFGGPVVGQRPGHAFVIRRDLGDGTVIGLGDNQVFTNEFIRYADNSGLGVALLAPAPGRVTVVLGDDAARTPDDLGSGDETLRDLVRPGVWMGLAQLALAFVVLALARGVRVGRAIAEPLAVPVAGSELVRARATVMQRAGHAHRAAQLLRSDVHRELCDRFGLERDAVVDVIVAAVVERSGIDASTVSDVFAGDVDDSTALLALSRRIAALRASLDQLPAGRPRDPANQQGAHR